MPKKFYSIKHKVNYLHDDKHHYVRIGSATMNENTGVIVAGIEAIPINWDGSFILVPSDNDKEKDF